MDRRRDGAPPPTSRRCDHPARWHGRRPTRRPPPPPTPQRALRPKRGGPRAPRRRGADRAPGRRRVADRRRTRRPALPGDRRVRHRGERPPRCLGRHGRAPGGAVRRRARGAERADPATRPRRRVGPPAGGVDASGSRALRRLRQALVRRAGAQPHAAALPRRRPAVGRSRGRPPRAAHAVASLLPQRRRHHAAGRALDGRRAAHGRGRGHPPCPLRRAPLGVGLLVCAPRPRRSALVRPGRRGGPASSTRRLGRRLENPRGRAGRAGPLAAPGRRSLGRGKGRARPSSRGGASRSRGRPRPRGRIRAPIDLAPDHLARRRRPDRAAAALRACGRRVSAQRGPRPGRVRGPDLGRRDRGARPRCLDGGAAVDLARDPRCADGPMDRVRPPGRRLPGLENPRGDGRRRGRGGVDGRWLAADRRRRRHDPPGGGRRLHLEPGRGGLRRRRRPGVGRHGGPGTVPNRPRRPVRCGGGRLLRADRGTAYRWGLRNRRRRSRTPLAQHRAGAPGVRPARTGRCPGPGHRTAAALLAGRTRWPSRHDAQRRPGPLRRSIHNGQALLRARRGGGHRGSRRHPHAHADDPGAGGASSRGRAREPRRHHSTAQCPCAPECPLVAGGPTPARPGPLPPPRGR